MKGPAFELWDLVSGNLVGAYHDRSAALAAVWRAIRVYGRDQIEGTALVEIQVNGESTIIAEADELIQLATEAFVPTHAEA